MEKVRVAAYCRVSTDHDGQMVSFDNQVEIYTERIQSNPEWVLADIYADPAISGTTDDRPEFQRMLRDAEKRRFDLLLVKSISRFARNTLITIQTIRRMQELGIGVIFEKENIDTSKPYSEMMLTVLSAFAQEESRNISERTKKGLTMMATHGEAVWRPIFGFRKVEDKPFVIEEKEAEVVRRVFREFNLGKQMKQIVQEMNDEGIMNEAGKSWYSTKVAYMLENECYAGDVLAGKSRWDKTIMIKDHHTPIISREDFDRAQNIREQRNDGTYPFKGRLVCPGCGKPVGRLGVSWGCDCGKFTMPKGKLEESVLKAYEAVIIPEAGIGTAKARKIKAEYPKMEKAEFWWIDDMISRIAFSLDGRKMYVFWKWGEQTELATGYLRMEADLKSKACATERAKRAQEKHGEKSVRRLKRKQVG